MSKEKFAFDKTNFILLGIGMAGGDVGGYHWFSSDDRPRVYPDDL